MLQAKGLVEDGVRAEVPEGGVLVACRRADDDHAQPLGPLGVDVEPPQDVLPGDLLVWDGHVAMYIGNGQIVEAGDPVAVSGLRTDNIGMSFNGFYRPTG